jgi:hypothetical protein
MTVPGDPGEGGSVITRNNATSRARERTGCINGVSTSASTPVAGAGAPSPDKAMDERRIIKTLLRS